MNYTDIETQILQELNRTDVQSQVSAWVDRAYRYIMSRHEFSWMRADSETPTVAGVYRYPLPSDFGDTNNVLLLDGTNSHELKEYLSTEFQEKHPSPESDARDRPTECALINGMGADNIPYVELHVWPVPNIVYTLLLSYFIQAPVLAGTLVPILPSRYHSALVYGGLKFGFARLREYDAAKYWSGELEASIFTMIEEDKRQPNVQRQLREFKPGVTYGGNDHLSPFVRRIV